MTIIRERTVLHLCFYFCFCYRVPWKPKSNYRNKHTKEDRKISPKELWEEEEEIPKLCERDFCLLLKPYLKATRRQLRSVYVKLRLCPFLITVSFYRWRGVLCFVLNPSSFVRFGCRASKRGTEHKLCSSFFWESKDLCSLNSSIGLIKFRSFHES